jgi:hypothetical protein
MKKSTTVKYSSEELKQLPSESDWEANAAMTEEEIQAAIASDPDDAELSVEWLRTHKVTLPEEHPDLFIAVHDSQGKLTMHRISKVVSDSDRKSGYVRVVDDTGRSYRVPVQASEDVVQSVERKSA